MKDLEVMLSGGIVFALFGIGGWLAVLLLLRLFMLLLNGIKAMANLNVRFTHINPYIVAHRKMLIEEQQYQEYLNEKNKYN